MILAPLVLSSALLITAGEVSPTSDAGVPEAVPGSGKAAASASASPDAGVSGEAPPAAVAVEAAPEAQPTFPTPAPALVSEGGSLFAKRCAICHGETGAGDGVAAKFISPPPRDLTRESLKAYRQQGGPSEGLRHVIRSGIGGTAMPRFGALTEEEMDALVAFVRSIRPAEEEWIVESTPVLRGREVYKFLQCFQCHGTSGAGNGPSLPGLTDEKGRPVVVTDLRRPRNFNFGTDVDSIARTMLRGIHGSPMPAYEGAIDEAKARDLAAYMQSLFLQDLSRR